MILTKEVEVKIISKNVSHYVAKGYKIPMKKATPSSFVRYKKEFVYDIPTTIVVKVGDLTEGSNVLVEAVCEDCGCHTNIKYFYYKRTEKTIGKYVCPECVKKYVMQKLYQTNMEKYGVPNYSKTLEYREKYTSTCLKRYGVSNPSQSEEVKEKCKHTNLLRYGVPYASQANIIKEKVKNTVLEHYGVEYVLQSKEVREAIYNTNLSRYGYKNVIQSPEIRAKINETLYKNGTQKSSRQQRYIHKLYGGELNYPISHYSADICFPDEKIVIEYDGGFHDGNVKTGRLTQEEFDHKEIIRSQIIKREGYKQIRLISHHDKLPSDEILLQILDISKQYFNDNPERSWIEFDFDSSLMRNALHKEGVFFDYGELRTLPLQEVA